jgi:hypothetical protein
MHLGRVARTYASCRAPGAGLRASSRKRSRPRGSGWSGVAVRVSPCDRFDIASVPMQGVRGGGRRAECGTRSTTCCVTTGARPHTPTRRLCASAPDGPLWAIVMVAIADARGRGDAELPTLRWCRPGPSGRGASRLPTPVPLRSPRSLYLTTGTRIPRTQRADRRRRRQDGERARRHRPPVAIPTRRPAPQAALRRNQELSSTTTNMPSGRSPAAAGRVRRNARDCRRAC